MERASYKQKLEVLQQQEELIEDEEEQEQVRLCFRALLCPDTFIVRKRKMLGRLRGRLLSELNEKRKLVWLNRFYPTLRFVLPFSPIQGPAEPVWLAIV